MARDDIGSIVAEAEREFPGLRVTNADRDVGQNAAVGGARDSQHLHGRARDLDISGVPEDRRPALLQYFRQHGVTGMGMYSPTGTSLHVDVRPGAFTAWGPDRRSTSLTQTPSYFQEAVRGTPVLAQATAVSDGSGAGTAAGGSGSSTTTPPPGGASTTTPTTLSPALQSIFGGMRGRIEEDIGLTRQQGEIQQEQAWARATGTRDAQRSMAAAERAAAEQFRSRPIPAFVPTQETAADMGTLFSLLAVAGQTLGGRGKTGAMAAMSAMTGMLNGYRQGRQDLYQKERQNFEAGLRQIQAQNQALQEMYTRATRAAQTDMQGALAEAESRAIELGAPLAALAARRSGIQGFNTVDQAQMQVVSQLESRVQAARQAEEVRKRTREDNAAVALERDIRTAGPATDYLYRQFNTFIPKVEAQAIVSTARAIGEGLSIADAANSLPENMGRSGQLRGFIERYLTSSADAVRNNQAAPATGLTEAERRALPEGEQNALLFAKRYASYLVGYERNLAGGARGFTVSFQNRFNNLMAQNQFSRQGFVDLMKQHVQELSQGAQQPGVPQLDFNRLARMGIDLHNQGSAPDERGSAQRGLELIMRPRTAEAPRTAPPGPPSGDVQARQRAAAAARASGGTAAPAATYNSLEDLVAAVNQGTLTREQAFAIAQEKGFD